MIFETLAATSDWDDDKRFNFSPNTAACEATVTAESTAGKLTISDETVRVGGTKVMDNDQAARLSYYLRGLMVKTPRSQLESDMSQYPR